MMDELIFALREDAEWAEANEWETPITLSDHLKQAADTIEELQKRVPSVPHGRLIDGDVAEAICFTDEDAEGKDFCDGILYAADFISKQPTIIEAEEGE